MRIVLTYHFRSSGGGVLIDPDGAATAVRDLLERYGNRLDLPALHRHLLAVGEHDAASLIPLDAA